MACFDPIPATPKWMIAGYLWLSVQVRSNCSFCEYLTGDMCFNCSFGTNLRSLSNKLEGFLGFFFSVFMKADVIIFAMFAQASLYSSGTGNPDTALFFLPTPEPAKNVNTILLWYRNNIFCELKVEKKYIVGVQRGL